MRRHDDITRAQAMRRLGTAGTVAMFVTLLLLLAAWIAGSRMQMARVIELCEQGGKFYQLGEAGDTPYRCTRVTDYPPSTTEGSTHVPPETNR